MRISDWSSDVCSSDLWRRAYAELFGKEEKKTILDAFDAALEATGFQAERSWGERIEDRGSQITFSALGQQAPRSEEHTSELQSLMRNSYAVFCLKKKKVNTIMCY